MRRFLSTICTVGLAALALAGLAGADPPPGEYFNGFEENTAGWFGVSGSNITRVPDFHPSTYANMVDSASGDWHARLDIDPSPASCAFGGGIAPIFFGPRTNWGGFSSIFPPGGYTTRVDVYLDVGWAASNFDRRFDWASAVSTPTGGHRRDFVFNVGTEPTGFVISASNNSTRCGAFPQNPGNQPYRVSVSGWYTFEHVFLGAEGTPLVVVMNLREEATGALLMSWTRSDLTDIIGTTVGGNRYGWFVQNEIDQLAIDDSERTGTLSTPGCTVKLSDGGKIIALNTDEATFGGNAKVSSTGEESAEQTYHDHGPVRQIDFKADTVQAVICDEDDNTAEIHGLGTVNGLEGQQYRIKLKDGGEPAYDDMYGITLPGVGYASGDQPLVGGNVQIRIESGS